MRVSQSIQKNMLKDKDGYDEGPVDLNLANRDTEIQFNNDPEPAAKAPTSAMEEVVDKETGNPFDYL